ncbi:MAG: GNAT family N-acetyltransferase [Tetragenococcus halophilus]|uniref:GNAT family N-acetyltransferase n=1 Tax=Tetragenococcus halophilus TaxID=51669 RepID=UPI001928915D|nr:GNAT family N-acetyltransferase [Tetragenococcus halophilus]MCF1674855.1 GNAT family N-acetyltransferase [Tetragenococcus halophilus]MDN5831573.1 GNAT family N-acetyltransferase [Tetragenococcus halophilus]MDN6112128.1 GNAT family N-acetyltransferase [Tetragenococcus halophilus]MDN6129065.1 GNAT family N-acetyltransferase [Tetragenococcus halophilus]MDN6141608.1 GNAT family N-acetyltransferase [Tetragenococcus halophilus]
MDIEIHRLLHIDSAHYKLLLEADPSEKIVEDYLSRGFCFAAQKKQKLLGIILLLPTKPKTLEIANIAVQKSFRGQKIGQQLILFALSFARKNQYKLVEIATGSTGFEQLYLYQKCGFRMTYIARDFFINHYARPIIENGLQLKDMVRLSQTVQYLDG